MTVVIGLKDPLRGRLWLGADTLAVDGNNAYEGARSKVFEAMGLLIGVAGTRRLGQIVQYGMTRRDSTGIPDTEAERYLCNDFVGALRAALKERGYMRTRDGGQEEMDGSLLIAVGGRLFEIESNFAVFECRGQYHAIGSGDEVAHGALFSTEHLEPEARVRNALAAAAHHTTSVRGPFTVLSIAGAPSPQAAGQENGREAWEPALRRG